MHYLKSIAHPWNYGLPASLVYLLESFWLQVKDTSNQTGLKSGILKDYMISYNRKYQPIRVDCFSAYPCLWGARLCISLLGHLRVGFIFRLTAKNKTWHLDRVHVQKKKRDLFFLCLFFRSEVIFPRSFWGDFPSHLIGHYWVTCLFMKHSLTGR